MNDLVLTLIGPDRPGLVEAVANTIAEHGGNWLESRMAHLAGKFAGILRVEVPPERAAALTTALARLEARGLRVVVERAEPAVEAAARPSRQPSRAVELTLVGLDRPGLVRDISQLIAKHGGNVEELETDRQSAAMSAEMLFRAEARVNVPQGADVAALRADLERLANDLMVEIRFVEALKSGAAGGK
jgi:glycine cleavage system regulatory protein